MFNADLITSAKVQDFIKLATKKKMDALQVSTQLAKEFSNEERAAIMDYMALVPKFREKFGIENTEISAGTEHCARYRTLESKALGKRPPSEQEQ